MLALPSRGSLAPLKTCNQTYSQGQEAVPAATTASMDPGKAGEEGIINSMCKLCRNPSMTSRQQQAEVTGDKSKSPWFKQFGITQNIS